jgi:hypothetical protein
MTKTQTSRRLDLLEDELRVNPDAPLDERGAALSRAMTPEDRAACMAIVAKYESAYQANPAFRLDDLEPNDHETMVAIGVRAFRRLKWPVREDYAARYDTATRKRKVTS